MRSIHLTVDGSPLNFDLAMALARAVALHSDPTSQLIAWRDRDADRQSPANVHCVIDDQPGWEVYGRNHGGRLRIAVNGDAFVFIYGRPDAALADLADPSAETSTIGQVVAPPRPAEETMPAQGAAASKGPPPVELLVIRSLRTAARCRLLPSGEPITLRCSEAGWLAPGEIVTLAPSKRWRHGRTDFLSGEITGSHIDAEVLNLPPLRLRSMGTWDPREEWPGAEEVPDWGQEMLVLGPRPCYEMEQVIPGEDPEDFDMDPVLEAAELIEAGDHETARERLMALCEADLRCLDAHAHLGRIFFDTFPDLARRHYAVGVAIGEHAIRRLETPVLLWGHLNNRPFLRCLHGLGLTLWRLGRHGEALAVFRCLLWYNPPDNQGIRFLLPSVAAGEDWREEG